MKTENLSSAEELLLVGKATGATGGHFGYALAGAAIADLLIAGRIEIENKRVVIWNAQPTGSAILDWVLAEVNGSKPRKLTDWISKLGCNKQMRRTLIDGLERKGLLEVEDRPILGIFPHQVIVVTDTMLVNQIQRRVTSSLANPARASREDGMLLGIASRLNTGLLSKEQRKQNKDQLRAFRSRSLVAEAVAEAADRKDAEAAAAAVICTAG